MQYEKGLNEEFNLKLVDSIEANANHYLEILSRAVDKVMPRETKEITFKDDVLDIIMSQRERRQSYLSTSTSEPGASGYAGGMLRLAPSSAPSTSVSRKSPVPPSFRAVNIIQHDDAGPGEPSPQEEPETIELPPAYTNIKPRTAPPPP